jgi:membrane-associated phospholipid phosphatase
MQKIIKTPSSTPPDPLALRTMGPLALWLPLLFVLAAAVSFLIDTRVAFWSKNFHWSGMVRALLETSQSFGNGLGVLVIALAIFQLDPARRWALPRLLAAALGSGLSADIFKTFVVRLRPRWFDFSNDVWLTFSASVPADGDHSALESFPSAHTATAVGLVFVLIWLYPRGRWLFCAMAVLVAVHRIQSQAHFPSDILFGAALGSLVGLLCVRCGPLARTFDRLEGRWRGGQPTQSLGMVNTIRIGRMANEIDG